MQNTDTRHLETASGHDLQVEVGYDYANGGYKVPLRDVTALPGHSIWLTPDEARHLARHLTEQADEADVRNL